MKYYVIDAQGNYICTETIEKVAEIIATEIGGDYIEEEV